MKTKRILPWILLLATAIFLQSCGDYQEEATYEFNDLSYDLIVNQYSEEEVVPLYADSQYILFSATSDNGKVVILGDGQGNILGDYHLEEGSGVVAGGIVCDRYVSFSIESEINNVGKVAYVIMGSEIGDEPAEVFRGECAPNLSPSFSVFQSEVSVMLGSKEEILLFQSRPYKIINITNILEEYVLEDINVLTSQFPVNMDSMLVFAEKGQNAYFYWIEKDQVLYERILAEGERYLMSSLMTDTAIFALQYEESQETGNPFRDKLILESISEGEFIKEVEIEGSFYQIVSDGSGTALAMDYNTDQQKLLAINLNKKELEWNLIEFPEGWKSFQTQIFAADEGCYIMYNYETGEFKELKLFVKQKEESDSSENIQQDNQDQLLEDVKVDVNSLHGEYVQFSTAFNGKRAGIYFFSLKEISEFSDENTGYAYIDYQENIIYLTVEIAVSKNSGSPSGPKMTLIMDLDSGEIINVETESYEEEMRPDKTGEFPEIPPERLTEIAEWFEEYIQMLKMEYGGS